MNLQDPRSIPLSESPLLCLVNRKNDLASEIIDWRTDILGISPKSHAMLTIAPQKFVSQGFTNYTVIPMSDYMKPGIVIDFVQMVNSNADFVKSFSNSVQKRLLAPPWQKWYDWLGILGQAIGQDWIHTPGLEYCSVDVIRHLVNACPYLPKADQAVINGIPRETNPEALWKIMLDNPQTFLVYGTYDSDNGVQA